MTTATMQKRVCLESKYLDSRIRDHLLSKLQTAVISDCTQEYGHILGVKRIVAIISHEIDRANSDNVFTVKFEADTLKPDKGTVLNGIVCMVYKDGIFITVQGRQKMLIPRMYLKEYEFDEGLQCYRSLEGGNTISDGDEVEAVVTASQYSKNTFSCFGSLRKSE